MLLLKRHLVELVRAGKKRQTVRLWSRALLRVGQVSYTPGLGKMLITGVDKLPGLEALTETDAVADGFQNLKELLGEIRRIYGNAIPAGRSVYRIKFDWPVGSEHQAEKTKHGVENTKHAARNTKQKHESVHAKPSSRKLRVSQPRMAEKAQPAGVKPGGKVRMTRGERETLRAFLVAQAPRR